jgi:hypothetical protein
MALSLMVFAVVAAAIVIRNATKYSPESPLRLWTTRLAVAAIVFWSAVGMQRQLAQHDLIDLLLSRSFIRAIFAILLVWLVFRDEL